MNDLIDFLESESRSRFDLTESYVRITKKRQTHHFFLDNDLLEKTFENLDLKSLKALRVVCKQWNKVITKGVLWHNGSLVIEPRGTSVKKIFDLPIVAKCPNFIWRRVDLRYDAIQLFFVTHGLRIRRIKFIECLFSFSTLQYLLICCPHLKGLEISSLPTGIWSNEGILGLATDEAVLKELTDLSLISGKIDSDGQIDTALVNHLIGSSTKLKSVSLVEWSKKNCTDVITSLRNNDNWNNLEALELIDFGTKNNDTIIDALTLLTKDENIKLKKLAIVPSKKLDYDASIDSVISRKIVHLDLRNLPITNNAFNFELPKLKRLQIRNSACKQISYLAFIPKLEEINLEDFYASIHRLIHKETPNQFLYLFGRYMHRLLVNNPKHFISDPARTNVKVWVVKLLIDVFAILIVLGLLPASVYFLLKMVCPDAENEDFVLSVFFVFAIVHVIWKWVF